MSNFFSIDYVAVLIVTLILVSSYGIWLMHRLLEDINEWRSWNGAKAISWLRRHFKQKENEEALMLLDALVQHFVKRTRK
jgi:hypothetical protein